MQRMRTDSNEIKLRIRGYNSQYLHKKKNNENHNVNGSYKSNGSILHNNLKKTHKSYSEK